MKKIVSAGLSALLLCGMCAPAYAANTTAAPAASSGAQEAQTPVQLSFDKLESTVRERNVSIKSYDNTVKSAEKTDVSDNYVLQYYNISSQITEYQKQVKELQQAINASPEDSALRRTLQSQKTALEQQIASLQSQYRDLGDEEDDAKDAQANTVVSTRRSSQNAADLICLNAENNYITIQTLDYTINQTDRQLAELDRQIAAAKKQVALGMAGTNTLSALQSQRETAAASRKTLDTQYDSLMNTLAIQCGYTTGTEFTLAALPSVTAEQLAAVNYDTDLAAALKNSYSIWSKEDSMRSASDDYENGVTNNLYAFEAAKIQRDAEKENVTAAFRALYKDLKEKQAALTAAQQDLAQAQKTWKVQDVQYKRGMISRQAYQTAQDTMNTAQETAAAAEINLLTAYNTYEWATRGVMTSTSAM